MNPQLLKLREELDNIDARLIALLGERFKVTRKVGELKRTTNLPPQDSSREARQMERIQQLANEAGIDPTLAQNILRLVIDKVIDNHKALR